MILRPLVLILLIACVLAPAVWFCTKLPDGFVKRILLSKVGIRIVDRD